MVSTRARQYDPYAPFKDVPDGEIEISLSADLSGADGSVVFQVRPKAVTAMVYGDGASEATGVTGKKTHVYAHNGTYTVTATQGANVATEHFTVDSWAETVPGAPTAVTGVDDGSGTAAVTWVAPVSDGHSVIVGYKIDSTVDDGVTWVEEVANTGDADLTQAAVPTGAGTFKLRVFAINAHGAGAASLPSANVVVT
jgi:hypothetical protein